MAKKKVNAAWFPLAVLAVSLAAVPSFAGSQARIVRLSDVQGNVQIDRDSGQGLEKAFLNLPVIQGTKLQSNSDARAEVEFEGGSTIRLAPETTVVFPQLSLLDSGTRVSTVLLQRGMAYVSYRGKKDSEFTIQFGSQTAKLGQPVHFRLRIENDRAVLAVFNGSLEVEGAAGTTSVGKKQTITFELADNDRHTVAKNIEKYPFDTWDEQQDKYHDGYLRQASYIGSPYAYGMSDLAYYGNFISVPGYGTLWQPYFVDASWDPFMNGAWAWYPGAGYMWVSAYPWGWMPYRYGSWNFLPGYGWMWQPGNSWGSWATVPTVVHPPRRFVPPQTPTNVTRNIVVVNRTSFVAGAPVQPGRIVIRSDSAGLGVPRGRIRDLGRISQEAQEKGSVTTTVHPTTVRPVTTPPATVFTAPQGTSSRGMGTSSRGDSPRSAPVSSGPPPSSGPSPASHSGSGSGPRSH